MRSPNLLEGWDKTFGRKSRKKDNDGNTNPSRLIRLFDKSEAIINTVSDGVVIINNQKIIKSFNQSASNLTGWKSADAINLDFRSIFDFFDTNEHVIPDDQNPILIAMRSFAPAGLDNVFLKTSSGKYIRTSIQVTPIYYSDESKTNGIKGFLNKPIRISDHRLEQDHNHANVVVTFHDTTSQQEENHKQSDFISTASHEMRTPVAVIEGYLGMLLNPNTATVDARGFEYAKKAHEAAKHLGHLFQDLLDVTKLDDNRMHKNLILVDANAAARQAVDRLQSQATEKGLDLSFESSGEIQPIYIIYVDLDQLEEILDNLVSNAIKYTKSGSIKVSVKDNQQKIRISVTDTGIGIPSEDVPHLFQKFYRVDSSDTREISGTGLGLYLTKKLTDNMNGQVGLSSEYGQGSTFWVEFDHLTRDQAIARARDIKARITSL